MHHRKQPHHLVLSGKRPRASHPHNRQIRSQVWLGDYRDRLAAMPDGCLDAIITDPPYGVTDLAYDQEPLDVADMWRHFDRLTRRSAVIVIFTCQPFTTAVINGRPKAFRYELIWAKNTVTGFLSAKRRPLRSHENILVFCRDLKGSTYNPQMEAGRPYRLSSRRRASLYGKHEGIETVNHGTRYPRTVRYADSVSKNRRHPSEKPLDLMRWLVLTYSQPEDLIADPFMGSAPVGQACQETGRRFIGVEKDPEYFRRAWDRLTMGSYRRGRR